MADTVKNPVSEVFSAWGAVMEDVVGSGNYTMSSSKTLAKFTKFARMFLMGNPGSRWDLEGDECGTNLSFQIDSFASGQKALSTVYDIDSASHKVMTDMGFRRTYGPELLEDDSNIKRVTSRYSRFYTGQLNESQNRF